MSTRDIDPERVGILSICTDSGHASSACITDALVKAVAGVSSVCVGRLNRDGLDNEQTPEGVRDLLELAGQDRLAQGRGEDSNYIPMLPKEKEAVEKVYPFIEGLCAYYRTSPDVYPNTLHLIEAKSFDSILDYDLFSNLSMLVPRPYLTISGTKTLGCLYTGDTVKTSSNGELFLIEDMRHADLYFNQPYVDNTVQKLIEFF